MPTLYLRLALLPFIAFATVMLMIRAQPFDNGELRAVLLPENCPAPCFMGIQPGVTTAEEAVKLLEASGWVESTVYDPKLPLIRMTWNNRSPAWLNNDGSYNGSVMWVTKGVVDAFMLDTSLTLSDFLLAVGPPEGQRITLNYLEGGNYLFYTAFYARLGLSATSQGDCDGRRKIITYNDHLYLGYSSSTNMFGVRTQYTNSWVDVLHTTCPSYS